MGFPGSRRRGPDASSLLSSSMSPFYWPTEKWGKLATPFHVETLPKESDPKCVGSAKWLKRHPAQFLVLIASCLGYSFLGLYIVYISNSVKPLGFPFSLGERSMMYYGFSVVVQGVASFMGDIYSPYTLGTICSKYSHFDVCLALTNVSSNKHTHTHTPQHHNATNMHVNALHLAQIQVCHIHMFVPAVGIPK